MKTDTRILIAGSHGFVGSRAAQLFPSAVIIPSELVRNAGEPLHNFIKEQHPDIILNAAAISDIGTCEKNPDASYMANVVLPVSLAKTAADTGAKLVSFSSDQVYTGCTEAGPYSENLTLPPPTNIYARHKLEAEQRALDINPDSIMLRATWLYDMPMYNFANRGNFLVNTINSVIHGAPITASSLEYRGITYVRQVVELLDKAFSLPGGVYNYGSENNLNMVDTARALLNALNITGCVQDTKLSKHNLWMDCSKLKQHGIFFDSTAQSFERCVTDYNL